MNDKSERRESDRFPVEFVLEVVGEDGEGRKFNEKTALKNISGGGAKFITQFPDKYFLGQSLEMTIDLPGTDEVKACMRGTATVVRIDPSNDSEEKHKSKEMYIAVQLDTRLNFERVEVRPQGSRREHSETINIVSDEIEL